MEGIGSLSEYIPDYLLLLVFGVLFAGLVYRMGDRHRGYTSLLVAFGVACTVIGLARVIGWPAVLYVMLGFAATGIPMIAGDVAKEIRSRERREQDQRKLLVELAEKGISAAKVGEHDSPARPR